MLRSLTLMMSWRVLDVKLALENACKFQCKNWFSDILAQYLFLLEESWGYIRKNEC